MSDPGSDSNSSHRGEDHSGKNHCVHPRNGSDSILLLHRSRDKGRHHWTAAARRPAHDGDGTDDAMKCQHRRSTGRSAAAADAAAASWKHHSHESHSCPIHGNSDDSAAADARPNLRYHRGRHRCIAFASAAAGGRRHRRRRRYHRLCRRAPDEGFGIDHTDPQCHRRGSNHHLLPDRWDGSTDEAAAAADSGRQRTHTTTDTADAAAPRVRRTAPDAGTAAVRRRCARQRSTAAAKRAHGADHDRRTDAAAGAAAPAEEAAAEEEEEEEDPDAEAETSSRADADCSAAAGAAAVAAAAALDDRCSPPSDHCQR
mmetsp:Transcript_24088/g.52443  ORF Transcript_24088/g.52443 Transcript_24088/m.52443 type:complete len:314 (-) Transcript_24088:72-1013(-)